MRFHEVTLGCCLLSLAPRLGPSARNIRPANVWNRRVNRAYGWQGELAPAIGKFLARRDARALASSARPEVRRQLGGRCWRVSGVDPEAGPSERQLPGRYTMNGRRREVRSAGGSGPPMAVPTVEEPWQHSGPGEEQRPRRSNLPVATRSRSLPPRLPWVLGQEAEAWRAAQSVCSRCVRRRRCSVVDVESLVPQTKATKRR